MKACALLADNFNSFYFSSLITLLKRGHSNQGMTHTSLKSNFKMYSTKQRSIMEHFVAGENCAQKISL